MPIFNQDEFKYIVYEDSELRFTAATAPTFGSSTETHLGLDEVGDQTWVKSRFIFENAGVGVTSLAFELKIFDGNDINSGIKFEPSVQNLAADARIDWGVATFQVGQNGAPIEGACELTYSAATGLYTITCSVASGNYDRVHIELGYINNSHD